uniref:Uncharacterized protein n=1 Tax=Medicago truncatula TaxID=3880 RepID=I3SMY9_MEDTR|nr:unknown [Medicago truncatula]
MFHFFLQFLRKAKMQAPSKKSFLMPLHHLIEELMLLLKTNKVLIRLHANLKQLIQQSSLSSLVYLMANGSLYTLPLSQSCKLRDQSF